MQTKDKHILTDGEVLDAVVNEYDEIAYICELYKYKMANSELPKLKKSFPDITSQRLRHRKNANT